MQISDERLREFQEAYKIDFGEEITLNEAREMFQRLLAFYELASRPLPEVRSEEEGQRIAKNLTPPSDHSPQSIP